MVRGTTAPFRFKVPYEWSEICAIEATFTQKQNDGSKLSIVKEYDTRWGENNSNPGGFTPDETNPHIVYVVLDPGETLKFSEKRKAEVQFKVYSPGKGTVSHKPERFSVYPINNDSVLESPGEQIQDNNVWILDAGEILGGDS